MAYFNSEILKEHALEHMLCILSLKVKSINYRHKEVSCALESCTR